MNTGGLLAALFHLRTFVGFAGLCLPASASRRESSASAASRRNCDILCLANHGFDACAQIGR